MAKSGKLLNLYTSNQTQTKPSYSVEEELNSVIVDLNGKGLQEWNINVHEFLIVEVEVKGYEFIQEWVTEYVIYRDIQSQLYELYLKLTFLGHLLNVH